MLGAKSNSGDPGYRRKNFVIPLKFKKNYAQIFMKDLMMNWSSLNEFEKNQFHYLKKGWSPKTMQEVRDRYRNDFPEIFPNNNFVKMSW